MYVIDTSLNIFLFFFILIWRKIEAVLSKFKSDSFKDKFDLDLMYFSNMEAVRQILNTKGIMTTLFSDIIRYPDNVYKNEVQITVEAEL